MSPGNRDLAEEGNQMSRLYDRADIYDLIESEERTERVRRDWKEFLGKRNIRSFQRKIQIIFAVFA